MIPGALLLGSLLGYYMAGRALTPVLAVAQTAQRISGSNLSLRIPTREAGDELDYLILTFNRMIERLEASFQQMRQFSTDVSHELRTPITAIRGQLEVALFTAEDHRSIPRGDVQRAHGYRPPVPDRARAAAALAGGDRPDRAAEDRGSICAKWCDDMVEQFQIPAEAAGVRLTAELAAGVRRRSRSRADRAHDHQSAFQRAEVHARRRRR